MTNVGWNVVLRLDEERDGLRMWIIKQDLDGTREVVAPIDLEVRKEYKFGEMFPEPTLFFDSFSAHQFLQGLVNGLVENGYKPDEIKAHDKEVEAMKYHLEDMRKLVFKNK
uniref:Uncharacterized protein n=1 Tax=viral metagenome TaxID=1070528 RepID=A0A6M3IR13_9ZZZZ